MVYGKDFTGSRVRNIGHELLLKFQRALLPPRCIACGHPASLRPSLTPGKPGASPDLCDACQMLLPINTVACRHCALPLSGTASGLICGRCLQHPPPYQVSLCAFEYTYPVTHLIRRLKYGSGLSASRVLGDLLANYLRANHVGAWPECFIPVPLHTLRYRSRGYNQVIELGRQLERQLGIGMRTDLVTRIRHTPEQAGLTRKARRKNLRRAFVTTDVALPRHVAVLDDVITTGSTMNELATTLANKGVERIEAWGLARASVKVKKSQ